MHHEGKKFLCACVVLYAIFVLTEPGSSQAGRSLFDVVGGWSCGGGGS